METTQVVSCFFDGSLTPSSFFLSCSFPVSQIETCAMSSLNIPAGAVPTSNHIAIATSTLVDNQVVGLVPCVNNFTTTFSSRSCVHSYESPRTVRGMYYLSLDNSNFVGTVYLQVKLRG